MEIKIQTRNRYSLIVSNTKTKEETVIYIRQKDLVTGALESKASEKVSLTSIDWATTKFLDQETLLSYLKQNHRLPSYQSIKDIDIYIRYYSSGPRRLEVVYSDQSLLSYFLHTKGMIKDHYVDMFDCHYCSFMNSLFKRFADADYREQLTKSSSYLRQDLAEDIRLYFRYLAYGTEHNLLKYTIRQKLSYYKTIRGIMVYNKNLLMERSEYPKQYNVSSSDCTEEEFCTPDEIEQMAGGKENMPYLPPNGKNCIVKVLH